MRDRQQFSPALRLSPVVPLNATFAFTIKVRAAQLMLAMTVFAVGLPTIVHQDPAATRAQVDGRNSGTAPVPRPQFKPDRAAGVDLDLVLGLLAAPRGFVVPRLLTADLPRPLFAIGQLRLDAGDEPSQSALGQPLSREGVAAIGGSLEGSHRRIEPIDRQRDKARTILP